jgi:hypothetical protein
MKSIADEIATGTSVADAYDLYADDLITGFSSGATDLAEYEVVKMTYESELTIAFDLFIEYLEAGYSYEDALTADTDLDYAVK